MANIEYIQVNKEHFEMLRMALEKMLHNHASESSADLRDEVLSALWNFDKNDHRFQPVDFTYDAG